MDALDEWNNLTPGWYRVEFMNDTTKFIYVKQFIVNTQGGVVYMVDTNGEIYNWNNVLKVKKIAEL